LPMGRTYHDVSVGPARLRRSSLRPLCSPLPTCVPKMRAAASATFCIRVSEAIFRFLYTLFF
jgi:hypothetical protein